MISIITAIYDDYDTLKQALPQSIDVEWVCITDSKELKDIEEHNGWKIKYLPRPDLHPNTAAKFPKMLPWEYTDYDKSIWIDASFRVISANFAEEVIQFAQPIAQFVHPWRDCLYEECEESLKLSKYNGLPMRNQVERYADDGHPRNWGLWATGVIARIHTYQVKAFGLYWLTENLNWSYQDQLSHPQALRKNNLRPIALPGTHFSNLWLSYEGSGRH